jgi:hypothetical protein
MLLPTFEMSDFDIDAFELMLSNPQHSMQILAEWGLYTAHINTVKQFGIILRRNDGSEN